MTEPVQKTHSASELLRERLSKSKNSRLAFKPGNEADATTKVPYWIPMGKYFLDATGGEGLPAGQITQLVSETADSGKTTLLMEAMVNCQKMGGVVFLIESEFKFDPERFELMGGNWADVNFVEAGNLEDSWNQILFLLQEIKAIRADGFDAPILLAWDSVVGSVANAIMEEDDAGNAHMAVEARLNNKNVRKTRRLVREAEVACVFINHFYIPPPTRINPQPRPVIKGGNEMGFMSMLIIALRKGKSHWRNVTSGGTTYRQSIGSVFKMDVLKNHITNRCAKTEFNIIDSGVVTDEELKEYQKTLRGVL